VKLTRPPAEKAFLVAAELPARGELWTAGESLEELAQLASTAGLQVAGRLSQRLAEPNPFTYIGKGKLEALSAELRGDGAATVLFDDELTPAQIRNIGRVLGDGIKVLDRTALILDIFAQHAQSREGQIQVEMAQYAYLMPRLAGMWTHLFSQQAGGRTAGGYGVGLRGPGETQLETDRRRARRRIEALSRQLEEVRRARREVYRRRRRGELATAVLVGYTNAGKSSLLNALCRLQGVESEDGGPPLAHVADQLFATLDPTTRRIRLPSGTQILVTDTVGFIKKLPPHLVAAFRATLEGIGQADLLLHVADASHPMAQAQVDTVRRMLSELEVSDKPALLLWNKIDALGEGVDPRHLSGGGAIPISARTGAGLDRLLATLDRAARARLVAVEVEIPYSRPELQSRVFRQGAVDWYEHGESGTRIRAHVPAALAAALAAFSSGRG
jgi:GTP-binding protein HflX